MGQSRNEDILQSIVDATQYTDPPKSRVEDLLLQVKEAIEEGGGGGGTSNYNDLSNQPQVNGNTLIGNKSASDLGLVAAENGKGLSTNDYTDADKAIVGGVTAALAGKQNVLTAGSNIKIDNNTISVNRWAVPAGKVVYTVITSDENYGQNVHVQRHTLGGALIDDRTFFCEMYKTTTIDDLISIYNPYSEYRITLLKNSDEQQAGYMYVVSPISKATSTSFTFMMEQEENANDLIIRSELDEKQDALTFDDVPTDNSNNPVKSNGIYDALALKQNATDNSLDTTAKTIVGAINEHEGDIGSLKSGLTNYERGNNWRIEAPERKNHYDSNADRLMYDASHAWWLDSSVNKIASGGNTNYTWAVKCYPNTTYTVSLTHTSTTFRVAYGKMSNLAWVTTDDTPKDIYGLQSNSETGDVSITITTGSDATYLFIQLGSSDVDTAKLTMQVEIGDTATTFAPYIPSVEARLESVESNKQDTLPITFIKGTADPEDNTTYIFNTTVSALSLFIFFGQSTGSQGNNGKNYIFTVASNYGNTELSITKIAGDFDISGFTVTKTATGFTINTGSGFSRTFFCVKLS